MKTRPSFFCVCALACAGVVGTLRADVVQLGIRAFASETPPVGLKTYADGGLVVDEILIVRSAEAAEPTPASSPRRAAIKIDAVADGFQALFGLGGQPLPNGGENPFKTPNILWGTHSKDGGKTWGPPRFIAALVRADASISGLRITRLPRKKLQISFLNAEGVRLAFVWRPDNVRSFATAEDLARAPSGRFVLDTVREDAANPWRLRGRVCVGGDLLIDAKSPPAAYVFDAATGLLRHKAFTASVVHTARSPEGTLFETRFARLENGDLLVFIPDGKHANTKDSLGNCLRAFRSRDGGATWRDEGLPFGEGRHFGVLPFLGSVAGKPRLFVFESLRDIAVGNRRLARAFGGRHSDDGGETFSPAEVFPTDKGASFGGVGVIPIAGSPTSRGTLFVGFHHAKILRGTPENGTYRWELRGPAADIAPDLFDATAASMNELQIVSVGDACRAFARTCGGRLWTMEGADDGRLWGAPVSTPLVHPDAPPMVYRLSDGKTLIALHHNRAVLRTVCEPMHSRWYAMPTPDAAQTERARRYPQSMNDWVSRSEIWGSLSRDGGKTWEPPRFMCANALEESLPDANPNYQLSYIDALAADGTLHLIVPQRWGRVLHLKIAETALAELASREDLRGARAPNP